MRVISITQLWNRAWELFKPNWQLMVGIFFLVIILSSLSFSLAIGAVKYYIRPQMLFGLFFYITLTKAGLLIARQGTTTLKETFQDIGTLIIVFIHKILLYIIPILLVFVSIFISFFYFIIMRMEESSLSSLGPLSKLSPSAVITAAILLMVIGWLAYMMAGLFGWAGSYYVLEGKAGPLSAIRKSFSLTKIHFKTLLKAFGSYVILILLGSLPCGLGLFVVTPTGEIFWALVWIALTESGSTPSGQA